MATSVVEPRSTTGPLVVLGGLLAAGASLLLPPPGLVALALAAGLAWSWPGAIGERLDRLVSRPWRLRAAVAVLVVAVAANLALGGQLDGHLFYRGDLPTYVVGARVGLEHGWSRIFDSALQRQAWDAAPFASAPFLPYLNSPPQAWLAVPLALAPYGLAYAVWVALMGAATVIVVAITAGPAWRARLLLALGAASAWVVVYSLASGQNAVLGALAVVLAYQLLRSGREGLAGLALALLVVRPNATFLVPVALLVSGRPRLFAACLSAGAVVGAVAAASLGPGGVRQFVQLGLEVRQSYPHAMDLTIQHLTGPGPLGVALVVAAVVVALATAAVAGRDRPAEAIAAGVLASWFLAPYIHQQDYLVVLTAALLLGLETRRPTLGLVVVGLLLLAPPAWLLGSLGSAGLVLGLGVFLLWLAVPRLASPLMGSRVTA